MPEVNPFGYTATKQTRRKKLSTSKVAVERRRKQVINLATARPVRVKDVQNEIGFKTPSGAVNLLNRLIEDGKIVKNGDRYYAKTDKPVVVATSTSNETIFADRIEELHREYCQDFDNFLSYVRSKR